MNTESNITPNTAQPAPHRGGAAHRAERVSNRLQSLDVLRGLTVALMILVNNGAGDQHFETLCHSKWNGMTVCDLVFPSFLFMVGVSIYLAFRKSEFRATAVNIKRIAKRTAELFAIGIALGLWGKLLGCGFLIGAEDYVGSQVSNIFAHLRVWGVLQRIALCYGIVALIALYVNHKYFWWIISALLACYGVVLITGQGYAYDGDSNIIAIVDKALVGYDHLYHKSPVDPEGLLGTIPSIAHTMIGFMVGKIVIERKEMNDKLARLLLVSMVLIWAGYLLSQGLPLNKRIWSPSYTLLTCGMVSGMLGMLIWLIDEKKKDKPFRIFKIMGMHAFTLYIIAEALEPVLGDFGIKDAIFSGTHSIIAWPELASMTYALSFVGVIMLIAKGLERKVKS